jgi:pyruvyltransferase
LDNNIDCPEVYGDPALLLPEVYNPKIEKKYKIGLIPHWQTKKLEKYDVLKNENVVLINFHNYKKWTDVIDLILSCKYIVSESLHGLIIAEAYNIPNLWIDIDLNHKYDIKFHDFFLSLKKDRENSFKLTPRTKILHLLAKISRYEKGENVDLKLLKQSCPFEINNIKTLS